MDVTQQPDFVLPQAGMDVKEKLQGMICQLFQKHGEDFTSLQLYNLARSYSQFVFHSKNCIPSFFFSHLH